MDPSYGRAIGHTVYKALERVCLGLDRFDGLDF
jgi:hypothetical protein